LVTYELDNIYMKYFSAVERVFTPLFQLQNIYIEFNIIIYLKKLWLIFHNIKTVFNFDVIKIYLAYPSE